MRSAFSRRASEFLGVALFASALIWLIGLTTYNPTDPVWFFNVGGPDVPANFAGRVGAFLAELSYQVIGYGAYLIPVVLAVVGWHYFWCQPVEAIYTKLVGTGLLFTCLAAFLSLAFGTLEVAGAELRAGGSTGAWLAARLAEYLNRTGSIIFILTLLFLAIILSTQFSFGRVFDATWTAAHAWGRRAWTAWRERRAEHSRERQRQEVIRKHLDKTPPTEARAAALAKALAAAPKPKPERAAADDALAKPRRQTPAPPIQRETPGWMMPPLPLQDPISKAPAERRNGDFALPPMTLLDAPKAEHKIDERDLLEGARLLSDKCREFSVDGDVVQIHPGPVVTTFEFKPDAGIKYSKVTSLADDLSLAMQAESVLIDRIPGKSTVGIQIPNHVREQISLRELLESDLYRRSASKLTLALGKTIHGEPFVWDLATMPHLLIAGSTGAGKSVAVNAMITSMLYRATPDDVRLIMIDPKRLELGMYTDVPHLLTPVVVDPKLAANALRWAVREMEERYKHLAAHGVRNIDQFNRNARLLAQERPAKGASGDDAEAPPKPLPFIVVIIDELADLMIVASNEVEESIARLAQMARAVGIHLILATQRPSVDVITGLIKANLPARISFRVASKTDSRTILDGNGAEQLLGNGDMLFLPPASSRVVRLHGPYISEQESARLASFLRKQASPVYDESITAEEKSPDRMEFERDDLYDEAARITVGSGQASISYLQRRLRIGFSRAARLVDMMEADGLVSAGVGGKVREVLVAKDYFEELDAQLR